MRARQCKSFRPSFVAGSLRATFKVVASQAGGWKAVSGRVLPFLHGFALFSLPTCSLGPPALCCWLLAAQAVHLSAHGLYPVRTQKPNHLGYVSKAILLCTRPVARKQQSEEDHPVGDDVRPLDLPRVVGRGGCSTIHTGGPGAAVHALLTATAVARAADGQASDCRRSRFTSEDDLDRAGTRQWKRISRCHY